jgi:hypothetical protein
MCEDRMLGWIFELRNKKMSGGWRKWHNEEFYNVYSSSNVMVINLEGRVRQAGLLPGRDRNCTKFWLENLKRWDHLQDVGIMGGQCWTGF